MSEKARTSNNNGTAVCCVCGGHLRPDRKKIDAEGHAYCIECFTSLSAERDALAQSPDSAAETYRCATCGGRFSADAVYDDRGTVICRGCFARKNPSESAGTTASQSAARKESANSGTNRGSSSGYNAHPSDHAGSALKLVSRITCPHCWNRFAPEQLLWVSQHTELLGDHVLGPEVPARFLPTRFTVDGQAIDARGMPCQLLACPSCHLVITRALLENEPLFVSMIGVPASGKSYLLTAMIWELRRMLPAQFAVAFNDADTISNRSLNEYEETLFLHGDGDDPVAIRKTELQGELYDQIRLGQHILSLPRPFLFTMRPTGQHPNSAHSAKVSRIICLYDNAGEHFQPGMDSSSSPVTQHLAKSRVLIFLYDPTQDPRLREKCRSFSSDPQLSETARTQRQETILTEASLRIRRYAGLSPNQKHDRPLLVIVPKSDVWAPLLDADISSDPIVGKDGELFAVDVPRIEKTSAKLRAMLLKYAPEFVATAEDLCRDVTYIPVSALGRAPEPLAGKQGLGIRPKDIKPRWASTPVLYMFAKWSTGLIAGMRAPSVQQNHQSADGAETSTTGKA